jgi:hypothetical protein
MRTSDWADWGRTRSTPASELVRGALVQAETEDLDPEAEAGVEQVAGEAAGVGVADAGAAAEVVAGTAGAAPSTVNSRISGTGGRRSLR